MKDIVRGGYYGRYLPNGYLVYIHQGSLFAMRFDAGGQETRGAAVAVLADVGGNGAQGAGQLAFTRDGTLAYLNGGGREQAQVLAWLSADGTEEPVFGPFNLATPRISPDGKRVAVSLSGVLAVYDTKRDALARLSSGDFHNPVWTPDGRRLLAGVAQSGISWLPSDGSSPPQSLFESKDGMAFPTSLSPDGRIAAIQKTSGKTGADIWMLPIESTTDGIRAGEPREFLASPASDMDAAFSPDGKWVAYASNDTGRDQVYVVPFPDGAQGGRVIVSGPTGRFPVWSRARKELFYVADGGHITVVPYSFSGRTFTPGEVREWSEAPVFQNGRLPTVDLAPDGKRFLVTPAVPGAEPVHVTLLLHFFDELRRRVR